MLYPETAVIYLSIAIVSSLLAYSYTRVSETTLKNIIMFFLFGVLFIPAAIRDGIGTDFTMYDKMYQTVCSGGEISKEFGYSLLMKFFIFLGFKFQVFIAFIAGLTYFFVLKVFAQLPRRHAYLYVVFFVLIFYLGSFSTVRQILALVIANYALVLAQDKKTVLVYLFFFFAFSIHYSAAVIFLIYLFRKIKIQYSLLIIALVVSAYISLILGLASYLIEQIPEWIPYSYYIHSSFNREANLSSGLGVIFIIFFSIFPLFSANKIVGKKSYLNIWFICSAMFVLATILSAEIHIFNRLKELFTMTMIYTYCLYFDSIERAWFRQSLMFFQILFFGLMFYIASTTYFSSLPGGLGVVPYVSIFSK